ncbi:MAG: PEP-CTERM sorting domain-containing protein [Phycisphaerales bacterium]
MKNLMVVLCVSAVLCGTVQANLLLNSDFETNDGYGGGSAANWTETMVAPNNDGSATGIEGWANHGGNWGLAVYWWSNSGNGGFYQNVAVTAGQQYGFSCWTLRDGGGQWLPDPENPEGPTIWVPNTMAGTYTMKIDWLDASANILGTTSTDITYTMGTAEWIQLTLDGTAPAGSVSANVGFDAAGVNNAAKFDEASFDVIPEPVTITLLGLGSLFLARRRK